MTAPYSQDEITDLIKITDFDPTGNSGGEGGGGGKPSKSIMIEADDSLLEDWSGYKESSGITSNTEALRSLLDLL